MDSSSTSSCFLCWLFHGRSYPNHWVNLGVLFPGLQRKSCCKPAQTCRLGLPKHRKVSSWQPTWVVHGDKQRAFHRSCWKRWKYIKVSKGKKQKSCIWVDIHVRALKFAIVCGKRLLWLIIGYVKRTSSQSLSSAKPTYPGFARKEFDHLEASHVWQIKPSSQKNCWYELLQVMQDGNYQAMAKAPNMFQNNFNVSFGTSRNMSRCTTTSKKDGLIMAGTQKKLASKTQLRRSAEISLERLLSSEKKTGKEI